VNILRDFAHVDIQQQTNEALIAGRLIVLVQVLDVDDFVNDASVRIRLFGGFPARGTPCAVPPIDAVYQVDRATLREGGQRVDDAAVELNGDIRNGRLRAVARGDAFFPLRLPFNRQVLDAPLPLDSHALRIAMAIDPNGASDGNYGAWVPGQRGIDWARAAVSDLGVTDDIVRSFIDIMLGDVCFDPSQSGGISIGFGFSAVRVQIDPQNPVVDAPQPGTCLAQGANDGG